MEFDRIDTAQNGIAKLKGSTFNVSRKKTSARLWGKIYQMKSIEKSHTCLGLAAKKEITSLAHQPE